jgi:hypothetical protein
MLDLTAAHNFNATCDAWDADLKERYSQNSSNEGKMFRQYDAVEQDGKAHVRALYSLNHRNQTLQYGVL